MPFTPQQIDALMRPLKEQRVSSRKQGGQSLSYLEAWDVKAHLTRIFGFGGWDSAVHDIVLVSCEKDEKGNYDASYQASVTLTIRDPKGHYVCEFTEAAVGSASLPRKGEALDMAIKTAESDALKRAAINLGTQFGLSLYNGGSLRDVIITTLVHPGEDSNASENPAPAPGTVTVAPVGSDLREDVSAGGNTVPTEVALELMHATAIEDNEQRILYIASFKEKHREHLHATVEVDGQEVTLARYADLIATGQFTGEGK